MVYTDAERLRQVFTNLVNNALKFCSEGDVILSCRYSSTLGLLFCVSDTGIGIPKDKQDLIFERFRQVDESMSRKYGGTGLGLAICRSIVELLGGTIWVESDAGKGASFYFTLPYDPDHVSEQQNKTSIKLPHLPKKKVLFVDKSSIAFDFLRISLRATEIEFSFASGAEEANAFFEKGKTFDLIFGDADILSMNDNLGFERISLFCPDTPLIIIGSSSKESEFRSFIQQKSHGWMNKPINKLKVAVALKEFIIA